VGKGDYKVVVRFNKEVTRLIKERVWHETLETRDLPDGRLEFTLRLDSLEEIERWILGWGPMAEVIGPKELIDQVRSAASGILKLYSS
jgi:predicted DNA-binding transcriptional regulator YafY